GEGVDGSQRGRTGFGQIQRNIEEVGVDRGAGALGGGGDAVDGGVHILTEVGLAVGQRVERGGRTGTGDIRVGGIKVDHASTGDAAVVDDLQRHELIATERVRSELDVVARSGRDHTGHFGEAVDGVGDGGQVG